MKYTEQLFNGILKPFMDNLKTKGFLKNKKKINSRELEHLIKTFAVHFYNKKTEHLDFKDIENNYNKGCNDTLVSVINRIDDFKIHKETELSDYKTYSKATKKEIYAQQNAIYELCAIKIIMQSILKHNLVL